MGGLCHLLLIVGVRIEICQRAHFATFNQGQVRCKAKMTLRTNIRILYLDLTHHKFITNSNLLYKQQKERLIDHNLGHQ